MVIGVDPVADVLALAVELGADAVDHVGDLARDELLHVLVRAVVVRAVADGRLQAEGPHPGADQQVRAGLGRGIRAGGVVRGVLGEPLRIVELKVAVDLVGGDVVVPLVVLPRGLDQRVRADDVRVQERARVLQRVVVVGFRRVVDHDVGVRHQAVNHRGVADVPVHEPETLRRQALERLQVAGVGELVQDRDMAAGVFHDVVDEVRADEASATCDEQFLHDSDHTRCGCPDKHK